MTISKNTLMHEAVANSHPTIEVNSYPPLEQDTRASLPTKAAAYHLNRKSQTLRKWACLESGPIRPMRINGRLAWRAADILKLLNSEVA